MPIELKIGAAGDHEEELLPPEIPQATIDIAARRTIDGKIIVYDHEDLDIVIMPSELKIVTFPKKIITDDAYQAQERLFRFLGRKGVILPSTVQSGNVYGALEASLAISNDPEVDPVQVALYLVDKFLDEEEPYFMDRKIFEKDQDRVTDPDEEESTELGEVPHEERKGSMHKEMLPYNLMYRWY